MMPFNYRAVLLLPVLALALSSCVTSGGGGAGGGGRAKGNPHEKKLLGKRPISLQWISWDDFGEARVARSGEVLTIKGEQRSSESNDYLLIDGVISNVTATEFEFDGLIETRVSHINGGAPFRRVGKYHFRLYGDRGFWRLVEMDHPAGVVDYVDIYFDLKSAKLPPLY